MRGFSLGFTAVLTVVLAVAALRAAAQFDGWPGVMTQQQVVDMNGGNAGVYGGYDVQNGYDMYNIQADPFYAQSPMDSVPLDGYGAGNLNPNDLPEIEAHGNATLVENHPQARAGDQALIRTTVNFFKKPSLGKILVGLAVVVMSFFIIGAVARVFQLLASIYVALKAIQAMEQQKVV